MLILRNQFWVLYKINHIGFKSHKDRSCFMFDTKIKVTLDYITGTKVEDAKALMAASSLKIMADDNLDAAAATVRGIGMLS